MHIFCSSVRERICQGESGGVPGLIGGFIEPLSSSTKMGVYVLLLRLISGVVPREVFVELIEFVEMIEDGDPRGNVVLLTK